MDNSIAFSIYDCNKRKTILVTHSALTAKQYLKTGFKVEVWNGQKLLQTLYRNDTYTFDIWVDYFNELSTEKTKARAKIEKFTLTNELTQQQSKVLLGLIDHNDVEGAMKGLYKILRRNKKKV